MRPTTDQMSLIDFLAAIRSAQRLSRRGNRFGASLQPAHELLGDLAKLPFPAATPAPKASSAPHRWAPIRIALACPMTARTEPSWLAVSGIDSTPVSVTTTTSFRLKAVGATPQPPPRTPPTRRPLPPGGWRVGAPSATGAATAPTRPPTRAGSDRRERPVGLLLSRLGTAIVPPCLVGWDTDESPRGTDAACAARAGGGPGKPRRAADGVPVACAV